jgi:hypothetical protein
MWRRAIVPWIIIQGIQDIFLSGIPVLNYVQAGKLLTSIWSSEDHHTGNRGHRLQ